MRGAGIFVAAVIGASCAGGDHTTEVRMVVESDIDVQEQLDLLRVFPLNRVGFFTVDVAARFPYLVVIQPDAQLQPFALSVQLRRVGDAGREVIRVFRNVYDVAFVAGERRMFVMSLPARCECQGTSCPGPGDADCGDLRAPALAPLDARAYRAYDAVIDLNAPQGNM